LPTCKAPKHEGHHSLAASAEVKNRWHLIFLNQPKRVGNSVGEVLFFCELRTTFVYTRWFKYDRDWFVCKQAALRRSCATLREWSQTSTLPPARVRTCSVLSGSC